MIEAAQIGTREVAGAIVASTLTTCEIFLPLVFMRSTTGDLFQALALVVVFALACSLLVALTLVPVLASKFLTVRPDNSQDKPAKKSWFQRRFEQLERRYSQSLNVAVQRRGLVLAVTGGLVVITPAAGFVNASGLTSGGFSGTSAKAAISP